jgi:competence protein ComEC
MHLRTVIFVTGVLIGIVAGYVSPFASEIALAVFTLGVMQIAIYIFERKRKTYGLALSLFISLFAIGAALGIARVQFVQEKIPYVCESSCTFDANIVSSPESKDAYQTVVVDVLSERDDVYVIQLRVPLYPKYSIGETVRVTGKANVPDVMYPHNDEKSFDYATYLHTKNIGSEMMFPKMEVVDADAHTSREMLGRWKESLVANMDAHVAMPASTLATGMLFGDSSMSKELTQTFRVAGLSHIIVLSGFNIALVIAFTLFVFAFLPLVMRIVLASFFVVAFVAMVGGEASVLRATAMAFIALLAQLVGRAYVARQALMISLFAIVMFDPDSLLHSVSLHLSFLATAGIVYLSEPIKKIVEKYLSRPSLLELVTTTCAAYFATVPYVMQTFGTVSVYALIANVAVLPLVPLAMLLSFMTIVMSYISQPVTLLFGYADTVLINVILFIAHAIERLPLAYLTLSISLSSMIVMYLIILLLVFYFARKGNDETITTTPDGYLTGVIKY